MQNTLRSILSMKSNGGLLMSRLVAISGSTVMFLLFTASKYNAALAQPLHTEEQSSSMELNSSAAVEVIRQEAYLLGVGDFLRVDVFNIPDYSGEFRVLSGGTLNLPVIGAVSVEGLSIQQAATRIEQELQLFVNRPLVTLSILEARPIQIAISGEVNRPGAYRVDDSDASVRELPTLTQVIELAGGITQLADIRQIEIQRQLPPTSNGLQSSATTFLSEMDGETNSTQFPSQTISINLWELLQDGNLNEDLQLQDGDRIFIPTATALTPEELTELASASFSPDQISINVVGEVQSPGSIALPPNTPLNQAILAAGGFNNRARRDRVSLIRLNPNGTVSQQEIEIDFSRGIGDEINPSLQPNDTIIVRRSGLAAANDSVGSILSPLRGIFNILQLFGLD